MQVNSSGAKNNQMLGIDPANEGMAGIELGVQGQSSVRMGEVHHWHGVRRELGELRAVPHFFKHAKPKGWFGRMAHAMQARAERTQQLSLQRYAALIPESGHIKTTGWLHGLTGWRAHLRTVVENIKSPVVSAAPATAAVAATATVAAAAANPDAAALASVTASVHQRFAAQAGNKPAFNELLHKAFGDKFDATKAETIRQQALAGDFSWAPKVEVVSSPRDRHHLHLQRTAAQRPLACRAHPHGRNRPRH
jgi:hypothetical protein